MGKVLTQREKLEEAAAVLKRAGAREVHVFGSAARGELREGSDIDLAVSGLPPQRFFSAMGEVADLLGRPLDLVDLDDGSLFSKYLRAKGKLQRVS